MVPDRASREIADWFRRQPPGAVIEWFSDHLSRDVPWSASWADICIPPLDAEVGLNWDLTIVSEVSDDDDELDGLDELDEADEAESGPEDQSEAIWNIRLAYDLDVHAVLDPHPPHYWHINEVAVPLGQPLTPDQEAELAAVMAAGPDRTRTIRGAWSADLMGRTISDWAASHADRPDLQFVWNPDLGPSPLLQQALEASMEPSDEYIGPDAYTVRFSSPAGPEVSRPGPVMTHDEFMAYMDRMLDEAHRHQG